MLMTPTSPTHPTIACRLSSSLSPWVPSSCSAPCPPIWPQGLSSVFLTWGLLLCLHCRNRLEHSSGSPVTAYQIRRQPQAKHSGAAVQNSEAGTFQPGTAPLSPPLSSLLAPKTLTGSLGCRGREPIPPTRTPYLLTPPLPSLLPRADPSGFFGVTNHLLPGT